LLHFLILIFRNAIFQQITRKEKSKRGGKRGKPSVSPYSNFAPEGVEVRGGGRKEKRSFDLQTPPFHSICLSYAHVGISSLSSKKKNNGKEERERKKKGKEGSLRHSQVRARKLPPLLSRMGGKKRGEKERERVFTGYLF